MSKMYQWQWCYSLIFQGIGFGVRMSVTQSVFYTDRSPTTVLTNTKITSKLGFTVLIFLYEMFTTKIGRKLLYNKATQVQLFRDNISEIKTMQFKELVHGFKSEDFFFKCLMNISLSRRGTLIIFI